MKHRYTTIFCAFLTLLVLLGGPVSRSEAQQTPLPTAKLTPMPTDSGMLPANTKAADQLAGILAPRMEPAYGILTTSLANMDNLAEAPHFGRMLMQQISSRLSQHGFKMIEARLSNTMTINKQGEFMLARDTGARLAKQYNAYAVLVGLYSRVGNQLYISTRVLRLGDSAVLAAYEYSLPEHLIYPYAPPAGASSAARPVVTASTVAVAPPALAPPVVSRAPVAPAAAPAAQPAQPATRTVASAAPCPDTGLTGDDALWEQYARRGQAFAHCDQGAPKQQVSPAPPRAAAPKAQSKTTASKPAKAKKPSKPAAKPAKPAKPAPPLEDLLGKEPLCPPGCVPDPKILCPPGCVPAASLSGAPAQSAPAASTSAAPAPVSPIMIGRTPADGQPAIPLLPGPAHAPAPAIEPLPPAAAAPAPVVVTPTQAIAPEPAPSPQPAPAQAAPALVEAAPAPAQAAPTPEPAAPAQAVAPEAAPAPQALPVEPAPAQAAAPASPPAAPNGTAGNGPVANGTVVPTILSAPEAAPPAASLQAPAAAAPAQAEAPVEASVAPAATASLPALEEPAPAAPAAVSAAGGSPFPNNRTDDGSAPAPIPATGIPAPAASQLGQFSRPAQ